MKRNIAVGPASAYVRIGQQFNSQTSEVFSIGEVIETWSGLKAKVIYARNLNNFGSWRYEYGFEVTSTPQTARAAIDAARAQAGQEGE